MIIDRVCCNVWLLISTVMDTNTVTDVDDKVAFHDDPYQDDPAVPFSSSRHDYYSPERPSVVIMKARSDDYIYDASDRRMHMSKSASSMEAPHHPQYFQSRSYSYLNARDDDNL